MSAVLAPPNKLTLEQKAAVTLQRMTDLNIFGRQILKIRPKTGGLSIPLVMNEAQWHLHKKIEEQRLSIGRIRAIVLKGRQQGMCLDPDTRVLTADLEWVRIGDVAPGQQLVAMDENASGGSGGGARRMRTTTVEKVWQTERPAYRITFDDGRTVICSAEHRWLSRKTNVSPKWRCIAGKGGNAEKAALRVGDQIRAVTDTWEQANLDDAWFGGMIDGEGSFDTGGAGGVSLAVSQRAGPVLQRMVDHCALRDYRQYIVSDDGPRKTKFGKQPVHAVTVSGMARLFRLMGLSRPTRFIGQHWWDGRRAPDDCWRTIMSIEPLGTRALVDIQTEARTFIAEGLVSHNSTYTQARFYWKLSHRRGVKAYILTHEQQATDNLFGMVDHFWDQAPHDYRPHTGAANAKELVFDGLGSKYAVSTAGSKDTGRSGTAQYLHGSEVGFWANAATHMAGIGQVVPDAVDTEIVLESTANGTANLFHELWTMAVKGKSEYLPVFIPWFWQSEYRRTPPPGFELTAEEVDYREAFELDLDQMAWRRNKTDTDFRGDSSQFDQEYPASAELAFAGSSPRALIKFGPVARARRTRGLEGIGPRIWGLDPAEYGDDDTSLMERQGRVSRKLGSWNGLGTMETVGKVGVMIDKAVKAGVGPDVICVDAGGIGTGVADRLIEEGYPVARVLFGESPRDKDQYVVNRDELWCEMRDWLEDFPASIEDSDDLAAQLTSVQYSYDSKRRIKLESKEKMKERGLHSPDDADALALTFSRATAIKAADYAAFRRKLGYT